MKISSAVLINKKCHSHHWFLAFKCERGLPKLQSSGCCHPPGWWLRSWGNAESKVSKERALAPDSWGAYERNKAREPRGLHLPRQRMLNSLTWYLIFDVQTACSLCCKLLHSLIDYPSCLLGAVFSALLRCCLLGSESKTFPPNKRTLLSGCDYIFQSTLKTLHVGRGGW